MTIVDISTLSIVMMVMAVVLSVMVPIGVIVSMAVGKRVKWKALLVGALLLLIFRIILMSLLNHVVNFAAPSIFQDQVLSIVYGGFAVGIFEEVARLVGLKFLIRVQENESIDTGISYGFGHGSIEAVFMCGLNTIGNLMMSIMYITGNLDNVAATLSGEELEQFNQGFELLAERPSYAFLMDGFEGMILLVLQISLSLFMLKALADKKWMLLIYAVIIHSGFEMIYMLYHGKVMPDLMMGIMLAVTAVAAFIAFTVLYRGDVLKSA